MSKTTLERLFAAEDFLGMYGITESLTLRSYNGSEPWALDTVRRHLTALGPEKTRPYTWPRIAPAQEDPDSSLPGIPTLPREPAPQPAPEPPEKADEGNR